MILEPSLNLRGTDSLMQDREIKMRVPRQKYIQPPYPRALPDSHLNIDAHVCVASLGKQICYYILISDAHVCRAPPKPVAALLSPVLWRLNAPDRFDMYSVGVLFMQLVFAPIRSDGGLSTFNK